jgi:hypothetical protein
MSNTLQNTSVAPAAPTRRSGILAPAGALVFVGGYLAADALHSAVATGNRPLPNDPDDVVYRYLVDDSAAVAASAGSILLSVAGFVAFVLAVRRVLPPRTEPRSLWADRFGLLAVVTLTVSATLSIVLSGSASAVPVGTAVWLHDASFIAGGVAHVVCLGLYVGLTGRTFAARGLRILAMVAAAPALLSAVSLVWFHGSALILLGRLLCMIWIITAAIMLVRAQRLGRTAVLLPENRGA